MKISPFAIYAVSNILELAKADEGAYKGCEVPSFEWATFETATAARTKGLRAAISGDTIFAAGNVRSNYDADTDPGMVQMTLTGPFSVDDPTGLEANSVEADIASYPQASGYKENAGGSFGQYEIGVAKVDRNTGNPMDLFVYGGHGYDELSGLAAKDETIILSGHFTGNLTALLIDGTSQTMWNSNIEVGGVPDQADQFHPNLRDNAGHSGVDDGFVISARASDGKANWMVRYPESNRDAQIVAVDIDGEGNIFGSGYKCTLAADAEEKVCDGIVAMMDGTDGSLMWEKTFPELGAAFFLKYDSEDGALYVSGTTSYGGAEKGMKDHSLCEHGTCAITLRLSAEDGTTHWERPAKGSPRWGIVDATGGVELAHADDGPYIYVAFDDVGDDADEEIASLAAGTHYAGCQNTDGSITPEFDITTSKVMIASDCNDLTFVSRTDALAVPASLGNTGVHCGTHAKSTACVIKYHKYTGLPVWAADTPSVAGLVASSDGVHISGRYAAGNGDSFNDNVFLPGYARVGGLGSQVSGLFNAKISAETGEGEFVMHSGGGNWDRMGDSVIDSDGNIYNVGFTGNLVMNWGGSLTTYITEDGDSSPTSIITKPTETGMDVPPGTGSIERHMFINKLAAHTETGHSCLSSCNGNTDTAVVESNSCFIDGQCYMAGATGDFYGKSCWTCDPSRDQRNWVHGSELGSTKCFIDQLCLETDDAFFYQRRSWSEKIFSECRVCDPPKDAFEWTHKAGYVVDVNSNPPEDCAVPETGGNSTGTDVDESDKGNTGTDVDESDKGNTNNDVSDNGENASDSSSDSHDHEGDSHSSHDSDDDSSAFGRSTSGIALLMCTLLIALAY